MNRAKGVDVFMHNDSLFNIKGEFFNPDNPGLASVPFGPMMPREKTTVTLSPAPVCSRELYYWTNMNLNSYRDARLVCRDKDERKDCQGETKGVVGVIIDYGTVENKCDKDIEMIFENNATNNGVAVKYKLIERPIVPYVN